MTGVDPVVAGTVHYRAVRPGSATIAENRARRKPLPAAQAWIERVAEHAAPAATQA
jgi:hypothetical protein